MSARSCSGLIQRPADPSQGKRGAAQRSLPEASDRPPQLHGDALILELKDGSKLLLEVSGPDLSVEHDGVADAQLRHGVGGTSHIQQDSTGLDRVGDRDEMRVKRPGRDGVKQLLLGRFERPVLVIGPQHRQVTMRRFRLHTIHDARRPGCSVNSDLWLHMIRGSDLEFLGGRT
jgi:hypothetical protein